MIVIGILAPEHNIPIIKLLKSFLRDKHKSYTALKSADIKSEYLEQLEQAGIGILIIDIYDNVIFLFYM